MSQQQKDERVTCKVCGKTLTREQSVAEVIGHRCETLLKRGYDAKKLATHYASVTGTIPEGFIKVADLDRKIKAHRASGKFPGLTISAMVKAIGKDRAVDPPLHEIARPIYDARRHRWVNAWLATDAGLKAIASGDFGKAPKA